MKAARGVLQPDAIGTMFSLQRRPAPSDLSSFVDVHWLVMWDLRGRDPYRSQVLPHPCVHLVFEPGGAAVHGISRGRFDRRLAGAGWAVGTKFLPAGFQPFSRLPARALTDRVLGLPKVLGEPGAALERACPPELGPEVAARHHVSQRTLQRLFSIYVGIGPKWVLRRYRLHEAVEHLHGPGEIDWARLALELGYYDQAHFARDFRSLVGRTPAQYDADRTPAPARQRRITASPR